MSNKESQIYRYGGQAVMEGVMMRGKKKIATSVRRPDGEIVTRTQDLSSFYTGFFRKTPFLRGTVALCESLLLGMSSLMFSADIALQEADSEEKEASKEKLEEATEEKTEKEAKPSAVKDAFKKWAREQGSFCLIAKAVAVVVMLFYLLTAIVYAVTLIVEHYAGGVVFSEFFLKLLTGLVYGVIIWLLSDAVLYLQKLYQMKKKETKDK